MPNRSFVLLVCMLLLAACDVSSSEPITPMPSDISSVSTPVVGPIQPAPVPQDEHGTMVASIYRDGHWDIYALSAPGELLRRYTFGEGDNRAPVWSPDGRRIAFESKRDHNWDVYAMDADGANLKRLTSHARFDGSPSWSPDGKQIAFTSDRDGDLDIWLMNSDGTNARNLTPKSPAQDFDPSWSPDGKQIAFTSMRDGNKEIYLMSSDGTNVRNLTQSKTSDDEQPAWSPDGKRIAFVSERNGARELYVLDLSAPQNWTRVTQFAYHQSPAWMDDSTLLFVAQSYEGQVLCSITMSQNKTVPLSFDHLRYREPDWSAHADVSRDDASLKRNSPPLFNEKTVPNPPNRPDRHNFVRLNNVSVIVPMLSDAVDDSFYALRQRVLTESGWDFLGSLSEAARPLTFKSNASDYLSWHKVGRAFDTQQDVLTPQGRMMEVAREDVRGETYWRVYLKTAKQDGTQGEPLREILWDVSEATRARLVGRGGIPKGIPFGYYVDFTELARQYGWARISSHSEPAFDWHREFQAIEYWHYQKSDGLLWWQALHEVYKPEEIGDLFSYENLTKQKYNVLTMMQKGIPLPTDVLSKLQSIQP